MPDGLFHLGRNCIHKEKQHEKRYPQTARLMPGKEDVILSGLQAGDLRKIKDFST
jgi:hypothetical protein